MSAGTRRMITSATAATLLLVSSAVWAQQQGQGQGRRPGGFGGGGGPGFGGDNLFALVGNEKIQKELEILDEQKADLKKLGEESRAKMGEAMQGVNFREASEADRDKLRQKMEVLTKDARKKLEGILIPEQMQRLKEISLQVRGTRALRDADVAAALAITEDQKAAIEKVGEEMGPKFREAFSGDDREANEKKMAEVRKESSDKTLAVLSATQREKYEKMKGEKFDIDPRELQSGLGGGGGGGTGGNQPRRRPGGNNN